VAWFRHSAWQFRPSAGGSSLAVSSSCRACSCSVDSPKVRATTRRSSTTCYGARSFGLIVRAAELLASTAQLVDIASVSGDEKAIADRVEAILRASPHLEVERIGDNVIARTNLGRSTRVGARRSS